MAVVAPTDRPKSVSNRCVIEVFGGDFVLSRSFFFFIFFCWCTGFWHRTQSDLFIYYQSKAKSRKYRGIFEEHSPVK